MLEMCDEQSVTRMSFWNMVPHEFSSHRDFSRDGGLCHFRKRMDKMRAWGPVALRRLSLPSVPRLPWSELARNLHVHSKPSGDDTTLKSLSYMLGSPHLSSIAKSSKRASLSASASLSETKAFVNCGVLACPQFWWQGIGHRGLGTPPG